eukprot:m.243259 g.243259  ORF g.243259 m.243259 type:complete len:289 (+) comp14198_c0_seq1:336-1202(+)
MGGLPCVEPSVRFHRSPTMRYAQLIMGPAGSGKSSYCQTIQEHCEVIHRQINVINLDPAAEEFKYPVTWDIRDVVSLDDVTESLGFGPNGGLIYCLEYLLNNIEVMDDALGEQADDYLLIDCPGQIELYTHIPVMKAIVEHLKSRDYRVAAIYLLDSQFMSEPSKYFSGILSSLATMIRLEIPHVNVLSKMDLVPEEQQADIESYLNPDPRFLLNVMSQSDRRRNRLSEAIASLVDEYSMVQFIPLDRTDEDSVSNVLMLADHVLQYGEDEEVRIPEEEAEDDDGDED